MREITEGMNLLVNQLGNYQEDTSTVAFIEKNKAGFPSFTVHRLSQDMITKLLTPNQAGREPNCFTYIFAPDLKTLCKGVKKFKEDLDKADISNTNIISKELLGRT
jgi:hypothetical protein